jgi:hypothetical protein
MFLWVKLVLENLDNEISQQGLEEALERLPRSLGEACGTSWDHCKGRVY